MIKYIAFKKIYKVREAKQQFAAVIFDLDY